MPALRQEFNTSLAGWIEMNEGQRLSYPIHLPARSLGFSGREPRTLIVEDASALVMAALQA